MGQSRVKDLFIRGQHHQAGAQTVHGKTTHRTLDNIIFLVILATVSQGGKIICYLSSLRKLSG